MALQGVPVPNQPIADANGQVTQAWRQFFVSLWNITGGGAGVVVSITPATTAIGLGNYANDADAKAAGVPLHGLYWNNSGLSVRRLP